MPIIYYDRAVKEGSPSRHPSLEVNEKHPCYRMVREAIDGKSVFHFDRNQAYAMIEWYCERWNNTDLVDEFGDNVADYNFKDLLKASYYVKEPATKTKKIVVSDENMEELHAAIEMEKKLLESIGEEKDEDGDS